MPILTSKHYSVRASSHQRPFRVSIPDTLLFFGAEHSKNPDDFQIDSIWTSDFGGTKDWRETNDRCGWPGYLNDIARESNAFRDEHFIRVILHLIRRGERVCADCGSSRAVKREKALRSAYR